MTITNTALANTSYNYINIAVQNDPFQNTLPALFLSMGSPQMSMSYNAPGCTGGTQVTAGAQPQQLTSFGKGSVCYGNIDILTNTSNSATVYFTQPGVIQPTTVGECLFNFQGQTLTMNAIAFPNKQEAHPFVINCKFAEGLSISTTKGAAGTVTSQGTKISIVFPAMYATITY